MPPRILSNQLFLLAVVLLALVWNPLPAARAFAPKSRLGSTAKPRSLPPLEATVPREGDRPRRPVRKNPPPPPPPRQPKKKQHPRARGISIVPLGLGQHHQNKFLGALAGEADPLKEFPTLEMKERFRKKNHQPQQPPPTHETTPKAATTDATAEPNVLPVISAAPDEDPATPVPPLLLGRGEYFATDHELVQIRHALADVEEPLETKRLLFRSNGTSLSCGSASCTVGGWKTHATIGAEGVSKSTNATSTAAEVFYLLAGFGCLTDADGMRHYFGPGDTVVVPPHWSGRWDAAEDLHRIWFVVDPAAEDTPTKITTAETNATTPEGSSDGDSNGRVVRARVIHYHELQTTPSSTRATPNEDETQQHRPLDALPKSETVLGTPGDTGLRLSCIACAEPPSTATSPAAWPRLVPRTSDEGLYLLEGALLLLPASSDQDSVVRVAAGDTLVLPQGWSGRCRVLEPVKALRVRAA